MNFTVVTGRLGKDAESRFTPSGQKLTSFTMARNKKKAGQEVTIWYNVTFWGNEQIDNLMPYLKKGSAVTVIGDLDVRKYKDKSDVEQFSLDVTGWRIEFPPSSQKSGNGTEGSSAQPVGSNPFGGAQPQQPSFASHKGQYNQTSSYTHLGESDEEPLPF